MKLSILYLSCANFRSHLVSLLALINNLLLYGHWPNTTLVQYLEIHRYHRHTFVGDILFTALRHLWSQ